MVMPRSTIYEGLDTLGTIKELENGWLVVWMRNADDKNHLYVSKDEGKSWTDQRVFDKGYALRESLGNFLIISNGGYLYYYNVISNELSTGFNWDNEFSNFFNTGFIRLSCVENNTAYLFTINVTGDPPYSQYEYLILSCKSTNNIVDYQLVDRINDTGLINARVKAMQSKNDNVQLFGNSYNAPVQRLYPKDGASFVDLTTSPYVLLDIKQDKNKTMHFLMENNNELYHATSTDGATLTTPGLVISGYQDDLNATPQLTVDRYDDVHLFYRPVSYGTVYQSIYKDGVWGIPLGEPEIFASGTRFNVLYKPQLDSSLVGVVTGTLDNNWFYYQESNIAPYAPNLEKKDNYDASDAAELKWEYLDPDIKDRQYAYRLQVQNADTGATLIDTQKVLSNSTTYPVPANTFPNDIKINWRVMTWDQKDFESPWSAYSQFRTSQKPTCDITFPTASYVNDSQSIYVDWLMNDPLNEKQSKFQINLMDGNNVVYDSGKVLGVNTRSFNIPYELENYKTYTLKLKVWDEFEVSSDWDVVSFSVDYTRPPKPTVSTQANESSIIITINNPDSQPGEPIVDYNDIYRKSDEGYIRIVKGWPANQSYTDHTPASGKEYSYFVRARGDNNTYMDSDPTSDKVTFRHAILSLANDPEDSITIKYNAERSKNKAIEHSLMQFAGRKLPVAEFGESEQGSLEISFTCLNDEELWRFEAMYKKYSILLYRDYRGRRMFVIIGSYDVKDERIGWYTVSISPQEVSFEEEV